MLSIYINKSFKYDYISVNVRVIYFLLVYFLFLEIKKKAMLETQYISSENLNWSLIGIYVLSYIINKSPQMRMLLTWPEHNEKILLSKVQKCLDIFCKDYNAFYFIDKFSSNLISGITVNYIVCENKHNSKINSHQ